MFIPANTWISAKNIGTEPISLTFIFSAPGFEDTMRCNSVPAGETPTRITPEQLARLERAEERYVELSHRLQAPGLDDAARRLRETTLPPELKDKLRAGFNVSVAELDAVDLWQRATVGVVSISGWRDYLRGLMEKVERAATRIANNAGAEITDSFIEYF